MVRINWSDAFLAAGLAALTIAPSQVASGAVADESAQELAEAGAMPARMLSDTADVMLRFLQEGGPESGAVRVMLTPETRPLTLFEARSAAQQAFLEALREPGLGDDLKRIVVVVRLMPEGQPEAGQVEQVFRFLHKGGRDWTVLPGE